MKTLIQSLLYRLHLTQQPALTNLQYWQARADLSRHLAASIDTWHGPHGAEVSIAAELLDQLAEVQQIDRYQWGRECDAAAAKVLFATYDISAVLFPRHRAGNTAPLDTHSAPTVRVG